MLVAWLVFPLVLAVLSTGCGLLVEAGSGRRLPTTLVAPLGFALLVVVGQFLTLGDGTAELTAPAAVTLAVVGIGFGVRGRALPGRSALAPGIAALGVFAVYAAPIVLSGDATLAGFIKLDDTATWLALTDRVMEHGRDLDGLAPSTYEATLALNLGDGYPVGAFLPFGAAGELVGSDLAWLIQPYIAFLAVLLTLALWSLARPLAASPALRGAAAFIGAQPALLFGYYLWGGVKEVAAAALIAALAAASIDFLTRRGDPRLLAAPAILCGGLLGVLSAGAVVWLIPVLLPVAVLLAREIGARATAVRATGLVAAVAVLALPLLGTGALLPPTSSPLTDGRAQGNLIGPLDPAQAAGIWPVGDFRLGPALEPVTYALIVVACAAALAGLAWCVRRRDLGPAIYAGGVIAGCGVLAVIGSPWVEGKALATASPAIPFAAMLAVGGLAAAGRRAAAAALALVVVGGIGWSNLLAYRDVSLAPRDQLEELAEIGERVSGEGPSLVTEYSPYAARYFLRDSDPESISELRRHPIALTDGSQVSKGYSADTDEIEPLELARYRTLVIHRSPAHSRPPAAYELAFRGRHYEAWQRPEGEQVPAPRLGLGDEYDPFAVPRCAAVRELAASGDLVAARGARPVVLPLSQALYPQDWPAPEGPSAPVPESEGAITAEVEVRRGGEHEIWLGGSIRPAVEVLVDGRKAGAVRHQLNNFGQYVRLGSAELEPGSHVVELRFGGADLHPGSGGSPTAVGPLAISAAVDPEPKLVEVDASEAVSLCGAAWDWIEVAP